MKLLKAIGLGIVGWVLIFFEVSILMFGFKLTSGISYYIIHYLFLAIISIILTLIYFNGKKTRRGFLNGLLVGIIFIVIGFILDAVITIPLWIIPQGGSYQSFFLNYYMLIGYLIIIILAGIVGAVKSNH